MGKFSSSKIFYNCDQYVDYVAHKFSEQMQQEGYDINAQKVADGKWDISIKKGGLFKAVLGMKSALKVQIHSTPPNVLVKTSVGIFGQQVVPTVILLFAFWPIIISQIWGLIKQANLDTHVMEIFHLDFSQAIGENVKTKDVD